MSLTRTDPDVRDPFAALRGNLRRAACGVRRRTHCALRAPFIEQRVFSPREGDLIIFPAWLPHAVVSGEAAGGGAAGKASGGLDASTARIAFAFNLECPAALASFAFSV